MGGSLCLCYFTRHPEQYRTVNAMSCSSFLLHPYSLFKGRPLSLPHSSHSTCFPPSFLTSPVSPLPSLCAPSPVSPSLNLITPPHLLPSPPSLPPCHPVPLPPSLPQSERTLASCALLSSTWIVTTTFQQQVGGALDAVETAGTPFTLPSTRVPSIVAALSWQVRSGSHTSTHTLTQIRVAYSIRGISRIRTDVILLPTPNTYEQNHADRLETDRRKVSLCPLVHCALTSHTTDRCPTTRSGSQLSPGEARPRRESSCSPHNVHCLQHLSSSVPLHKHQITTFFAAFRLHTRPAILMQHMHVSIWQCPLSQPLSSCTPLTTRSACTHCTVPASRPLPTQALLPPPPQAVVACVSDSLHKTTSEASQS